MGSLIPYDVRRPHPFTGHGHKFGDASFLCPVCAEPLFGEDGVSDQVCAHVLFVFNRSGALRCRDGAVRDLVTDAQRAAQDQGGDPMEGLRKQLGSNVVFFELTDQPAGSMEAEVFTFVIDLASSADQGIEPPDGP